MENIERISKDIKALSENMTEKINPNDLTTCEQCGKDYIGTTCPECSNDISPDVTEIKEIEPAPVPEVKEDKPVEVDIKLPTGTPITLDEEVKILKALSNIMDEETDPEVKKDMPEIFFVMDCSQIQGFEPKTQEGRRILARFYNHRMKSPKLDYKLSGPSMFDCKALQYALKVFDYQKPGKGKPIKPVTITTGKDTPIRIEDEHFIYYLAPRIESV
jgi:hypothetical protein